MKPVFGEQATRLSLFDGVSPVKYSSPAISTSSHYFKVCHHRHHYATFYLLIYLWQLKFVPQVPI